MLVFDESTRHQVHAKLAEVLGREEADAIMTAIPPMAWTELATKADIDAKFENFANQLRTEMHREFVKQTRWMIATFAASAAGITTIAFAAAGLS